MFSLSNVHLMVIPKKKSGDHKVSGNFLLDDRNSVKLIEFEIFWNFQQRHFGVVDVFR